MAELSVGALTGYLQDQFQTNCPAGWTCAAEQALLSEELSDLLGYQSRADVLLSRVDGSRHLWIEFEISRTDPVANHAKYGTANIFSPKGPEHALVSMVSSHVTRGRGNLAAASVYLLRRAGVQSFQTSLYPHLGPDEVKALNGLPVASLIGNESLAVAPEIDRAIVVSSPLLHRYSHRIYFASNSLEVLLNVRRWNAQILEPEGRRLWGARTVTYFVVDPSSVRFAPSKFCGFVPSTALNHDFARGDSGQQRVDLMEIAAYAELDESESRFDGHLAKNHLVQRLGFREVEIPAMNESVRAAFRDWVAACRGAIRVHRRGARLLLAPEHARLYGL